MQQAKIYLLTSTHFSGNILFKFDVDDKLISYDAQCATLTPQQKNWLLNRLPKNLMQLQNVIKESKGAKLTQQLKQDWLFDDFWRLAYLNKGSSKALSLKIWNKYPPNERDKAANYWPTYLRNKNDGEGIKYVETYLRSEIWNN